METESVLDLAGGQASIRQGFRTPSILQAWLPFVRPSSERRRRNTGLASCEAGEADLQRLRHGRRDVRGARGPSRGHDRRHRDRGPRVSRGYSSPSRACRSLYRYQRRLRLARALDLISQYDDLTTLGLDLGFSSHSHFTAAFREVYGYTPSEFRSTALSPSSRISQLRR